MLHVALWEPEIPPNAGNVARLCAATATRLHFIGRLGFRLDDRSLQRAGLDYWPHVDLAIHTGWDEFWSQMGSARVVCLSSKAKQIYTQFEYRDEDCLVFGNESKGLPAEILRRFAPSTVTIPMPSGKVRSLNLATSVGIVLYEALRQRNGW